MTTGAVQFELDVGLEYHIKFDNQEILKNNWSALAYTAMERF